MRQERSFFKGRSLSTSIGRGMFSKSRPVKRTGTGDREWLYDAVLKFIVQRHQTPQWFAERGIDPWPRSDLQVWEHFCPMYDSNTGRETWDRKNRTTKRTMLQSTVKRLITDGRVKVVEDRALNTKTMNGSDRRDLEHRRRVFGRVFDGRARSYKKIEILDGIVQALEASE